MSRDDQYQPSQRRRSKRRDLAGRPCHWAKSRFRQLRHEPLEDRRLLTSVSHIDPSDGAIVIPPSLSNASAGVASLTAMDGGNGGWAVWYGQDAISSDRLQLAVDEDTLGDEERSHTTEQVAFVIFEDEAFGTVDWIETGVVPQVTETWRSVTLQNTFSNMVVVATPTVDAGDAPLVPRIRNAVGNGFDIRVDPVDGWADPLDPGIAVQYLVVEEGTYTESLHGVKMEAVRFTSSVTDYAGSPNPDDPDNPYYEESWVGQLQTYSNSYTRPVVLGQVQSANDENFSVFWSRGTASNSGEPPTRSTLYIGKHVGEDPDGDVTTPPSRDNETLGYVVVESGLGSIGQRQFLAGITGDTILGVDDGPPFQYQPAASFELRVDFDGPFDPTTVSPSNLVTSSGVVAAANILDADSVVYTVTELTGEDVLAVSFQENSIKDRDGNAIEPFSAVFYVDSGNIVPLDSFEAIQPLGASVYGQSHVGAISTNDDADQFEVTVEPDQRLGVTIVPRGDIQLSAVLEGPEGVVTSDAAGVPGEGLLLEFTSTLSTTSGFIVTIEGLGGTTGEYELDVVSNAKLEDETHGGSSNNVASDAQVLEFTPLDGGGAVATIVGRTDGLGLSQAVTRTFTSHEKVRIRDLQTVLSTITVDDSFPVADLNVQINIEHAADRDLHVFLNGPDGTRVQLFLNVGGLGDNFTNTVFDDEAPGVIDGESAPFTGTYRPDGRLKDFDGLSVQGDWMLEISDDLKRDTGTLLDWSIIVTDAPAQADYYELDLQAGERLTLSATHHLTDAINVQLASAGQIIATGAATAGNLHKVIDTFEAPNTGTYFAVVTGELGRDYTLVATRNASFDQEGNNAISAAQNWPDTSVIGRLGSDRATFVDLGSGGLQNGINVKFGPDGNLYVSDFYAGHVFGDGRPIKRYDRVTGEFIDDFITNRWGAGYGDGFDFGPDGNLYTEGRRYDGKTGAYLAITSIEGRDIDFAHDGYIYTTDVTADRVQRYDALTTAYIDDFVPRSLGGLDFAWSSEFGPDANGDDNEDLYVSSHYSNQILIYDGISGDLIAPFAEFPSPRDFLFGPDITGDGTADMLLAAGGIFRLDGATGELIDTYVAEGFEGMHSNGLMLAPDGTLYVASRSNPYNQSAPGSVLRFGVPKSDFFGVTLAEGEVLELSTHTPYAGGALPLNGLDPMIRLLDQSGTVVLADDNSAADGKNAQLTYAVPPGLAGQYFVEILPSVNTAMETAGDYVLSRKISQPVNPTLFIDDVTLYEGQAGTTTDFVFTVTRDVETDTPVAVDFATVDGTATADDFDYVPGSGTLHFGPGEVTKQIRVSVVGDSAAEPDESFSVLLLNPTEGAPSKTG